MARGRSAVEAGLIDDYSALRYLARARLDDCYRGELAESLARDLAAAGSPLALADLRRHEARWRTPLAA